MQISKLTITPISKGWAKTVINNPSTQRSQLLINDRLHSGFKEYGEQPRVFRRIPKFLKGFVNPAAKVGESGFSKNI